MLNQVEAYVIVGLVSDKDSFFKSNVMCSPQNKKGIYKRCQVIFLQMEDFYIKDSYFSSS